MKISNFPGDLVRDDPERDHCEAAAQPGARGRARSQEDAHAQDLLPDWLHGGDALPLAQVPRQVGIPVPGQPKRCGVQIYLGVVVAIWWCVSDMKNYEL